MNRFYFQLKENLGLSLILFIGLGVEFSNFQAMFFRFMSMYRPDWGAFNHLPAIFLSAFLLLCIVIFGIRRQTTLSWFLALLTCVISFSVYSRMKLSWEWENMHEIHFVVIILSGMLPLLVAYTTHQLARSEETEYYASEEQEKLEGFIREIRQLQMQKQYKQPTPKPHYEQHFATPPHAHAHTHPHTQATHHAAHQETAQHGHTGHTVNFSNEEVYGKRKVNYEVNQMIKPEKMGADQEESQVCEECQTSLEGKRKGAKYCSKECSSVAQKRRKNIAAQQAMPPKQTEKPVIIRPMAKEVANEMSNIPFVPSHLQTTTTQKTATQYGRVPEWKGIFESEKHLQNTANSPISSANLEANLETEWVIANKQTTTKNAEKQITKPTNQTTNQTKERLNENVQPLGNDFSFSCDYCGKETPKTNTHSRYCSEVCRIGALKTKQRSDFYVQQDEFETAGFIEWKNPARIAV